MTMINTGGRPKLSTQREKGIRIRVTNDEHADFSAAADLAAITTSSWCRMILREAAMEKLIRAGLRPCIDPTKGR